MTTQPPALADNYEEVIRDLIAACRELGRAANPHTYYTDSQKVKAINLSLAAIDKAEGRTS